MLFLPSYLAKLFVLQSILQNYFVFIRVHHKVRPFLMKHFYCLIRLMVTSRPVFEGVAQGLLRTQHQCIARF